MGQHRSIVISLDVPREKSTRFLEYFRARMPFHRGWEADHHFQPDGSLVEDVSGLVEVGGERASLRVQLRWDHKGSLIHAVFESEGSDDWQGLARDWVQRASLDAYSEKLESHYYRDALSYFGPPLEGEYWLDGFRLAPFEPWGVGQLVEQIATVDCDVRAVDPEHAVRVGRVRTHRFASLVGLFLGIGLRRVRAERRWVRLDDGQYVRGVLGPPVQRLPRPTRRPKKGELCPLGGLAPVDRTSLVFQPSLAPLRPPEDIRQLFRAVRELTPPEEDAFIGAANLASIALTLGRDYPSVGLAYWVAAVDALPNKPKGEVAFRQMVERYCPEAPQSVAEYGYGQIRSGHFHEGELPAGEADEADSITLFSPPALKERGTATSLLPIVMRTVLIRWLLDPARAS